MPGEEALYAEVEDLYPDDEDSHSKLLNELNQQFTAADQARSNYHERWKRYYKLRRSYIKRKEGDWHSRVFYPMCFWVIETVAPRLVASLPEFVVYPVSEDDQEPARRMEELLRWAKSNSGLYLQLVMAVKSALTYGTGILKTYQRRDVAHGTSRVPVMEPIRMMNEQAVIDPDSGAPMFDMQGNPVVESIEQILGEQPTGQFSVEPSEYVTYEGPGAEAVDLFNFWVAPEAQDVQNARYTIQRVYRDRDYIDQKIAEGVFHLPSHLDPGDWVGDADQERWEKEGEVELWSGSHDPTRKAVELREFWTLDGRVATVANEKVILRHTRNPFHHGMKPYCRMVDYLMEHEFYGVGEIEPLEGIQDSVNAISNQRIDNIRLILNRMLGVSIDDIEDPRDLVSRPGGIVRVRGGRVVQEAIMPIDVPDVTNSAYMEVDALERAAEKVSAVTGYQTGVETPSLNRTATGASLLNQAGESRFAMKNKLIELMGLKDLARMYAMLIQQFFEGERAIRIMGPDGQFTFEHFTPEGIMGGFDFDIEAMSAAQTEAVQKDQGMTLLQQVGAVWPQAVPALLEDLLRVFGKKDLSRYNLQPQPALVGPDGQPIDPATAAALAAGPLPQNGETGGGQP
jgi:hypothetical protein